MTVTPYSSAAPVHRDVTAPAPQVPAADTADEGFFGSDGLNFDDFLDLINPLQHLPIISTFYRAVTGDEISIGSRVLGGALFGGIIGFVAAMVNAFIADTTARTSASMSLRCSTTPTRNRKSPPPRRHSPPQPAPAGTRRPSRPARPARRPSRNQRASQSPWQAPRRPRPRSSMSARTTPRRRRRGWCGPRKPRRITPPWRRVSAPRSRPPAGSCSCWDRPSTNTRM